MVNQKWVYGNLVITTHFYGDELEKPKTSIIPFDADIDWGCAEEVDPNTVCQYIGFNDQDDNELYENDVCECTIRDKHFIALIKADDINPCFCLEYNDGCELQEYDFFVCGLMEIKKLGNILENPELMVLVKTGEQLE